MKLWQYLRAKKAKAKGERSYIPATKTDKALRKAIEETGQQLAKESGQPEENWIDYAAPLVERWEGMARRIPGGKVTAYPDPGTGDKPWTIGVGSTTDEDGYPIAPGTVWTIERARKRFRAHLEEFGHEVDRLLDGAPTTPTQKAAIVSWVYNVGASAAARSTLMRKHKAGDFDGAANEFRRWNKAAGRVMRGLTRRRENEAELYRSGSVT